MARSPLDRGPPKTFTPPRFSASEMAFIIECPNGEVLKFSSREAAWKAYYKLRKGI